MSATAMERLRKAYKAYVNAYPDATKRPVTEKTFAELEKALAGVA